MKGNFTIEQLGAIIEEETRLEQGSLLAQLREPSTGEITIPIRETEDPYTNIIVRYKAHTDGSVSKVRFEGTIGPEDLGMPFPRYAGTLIARELGVTFNPQTGKYTSPSRGGEIQNKIGIRTHLQGIIEAQKETRKKARKAAITLYGKPKKIEPAVKIREKE